MERILTRDENKLTLLTCIFVTSVTTANVLAGKIVQFGGFFVVPAAVVTYAFTFLITDIIGEIYGKQAAQRAVYYGFAAQVFAMLMIYIAGHLPVAPFAPEIQEAFQALLGQNARFVLASMVAYFVAQTWDVMVFHSLKSKTNGRHKWLRNNASTMSSQFIDTAIFITIGFWGAVPSIWAMIISQYAVKVALALLDTPIFYLLTRETHKPKPKPIKNWEAGAM